MKSIVLIVLFGCTSHLFILKGQELSYTKEQEIISWIQRHAFPIEKIGADVYITDLEPMEQILTGVRVVGMGELSHGTSECYQFEHRLFEFLVKRMGFKAVAIEASTAACESINEYVLYNKGTLTEALTGQGYSLWDTEEMSALIEWMRSYNQRVPNTQKVQFLGMDLGFNELGRKRVSAFVEEFLPEWSARIDSIFEQMTIADPKMPMRMNEFKDKAVILLPKLQAFSQYLETKREALIMASSLQDFEKIKQYTRVMEQFLAFHIDYGLRSGFMGENLLYYTEQMPDSKFIVLAHKWHIAAIPELNNLGNKLRKNMGKAYYAFCFESNRGSFLSRTWNADQLYLGEFKIIELPLTEGKNLPWYLTKAKKGNFFLDLRTPESSLTIKEWIETPQDMHTPGWIPKNIADNKFLYPLSLNIFDGVIFFEQTTASHPTKNALNLVPKKEGL